MSIVYKTCIIAHESTKTIFAFTENKFDISVLFLDEKCM